MRFIFIFLFAILLSSCAVVQESSKAETDDSLDGTVYTIIEPKIHAFVGRKISAVKDRPTKTVLETVVENGIERTVERRVVVGMDPRITATYEIIDPINEHIGSNVITFEAYDHFGQFGFEKYEYALLFIMKYGDGYILEKYQHDTVFRTHDGRWAACGESPIDASRYNLPTVHAEEIDFSPEISFGPLDYPPSVADVYDTEALEEYWNSSVFEIFGEKAICKKGIYAEDLFDLRMNTVVNARYKRDRAIIE